MFKLAEVLVIVIGLIIVFINSVDVVLPTQFNVYLNFIDVLLVCVKLIGQMSISGLLLLHYEIILRFTTVHVEEEV